MYEGDPFKAVPPRNPWAPQVLVEFRPSQPHFPRPYSLACVFPCGGSAEYANPPCGYSAKHE